MTSNIYFRPAAEQPYHMVRAAHWLVNIDKFKNFISAYNTLIYLEIHNPNLFKHYMDEYYRVHTFKVGYVNTQNNLDKSFRSATGPYGEESHMYYYKKM